MFVTSAPSRSTRPAVGCSKPAISRSVVVLPQPEGPRSEKNSPLETTRSTSSTAISTNRLLREISSICPPDTGDHRPVTAARPRRRAARDHQESIGSPAGLLYKACRVHMRLQDPQPDLLAQSGSRDRLPAR